MVVILDMSLRVMVVPESVPGTLGKRHGHTMNGTHHEWDTSPSHLEPENLKETHTETCGTCPDINWILACLPTCLASFKDTKAAVEHWFIYTNN